MPHEHLEQETGAPIPINVWLSKLNEHQVTLNEHLEQETGAPIPTDTIPIEQPKPHRTLTKPGEHKLRVTLDDNEFHNLQESADGRPLNVWLSKLIASATISDMVHGHNG